MKILYIIILKWATLEVHNMFNFIKTLADSTANGSITLTITLASVASLVGILMPVINFFYNKKSSNSKEVKDRYEKLVKANDDLKEAIESLRDQSKENNNELSNSINSLNTTVTALNKRIDSIEKQEERTQELLRKDKNRLDAHETVITNHDHRLSNLDHQAGYIGKLGNE